jgi:hypothetical protein
MVPPFKIYKSFKKTRGKLSVGNESTLGAEVAGCQYGVDWGSGVF